MATAVAARRRPAADADALAVRPRRARRLVLYLVVVLGFLALWIGVKALFGVPWRAPGAVIGPDNPVIWDPPFRWSFASDLNLPHVWNIALAFGQPWERGSEESLAQYLFGAALYT